MTDIEKLTGMTDAECEYWDDCFTKEVFSYLCVQAEEFHKSPTQVINDLVREKLAL